MAYPSVFLHESREAALVLRKLVWRSGGRIGTRAHRGDQLGQGIDYILETLRQPMEQKQLFQQRKFLADFGGIQRQPAYRTQPESRGNRLLARARLSPQNQRLLLVGSRYSLAKECLLQGRLLQSRGQLRLRQPACTSGARLSPGRRCRTEKRLRKGLCTLAGPSVGKPCPGP